MPAPAGAISVLLPLYVNELGLFDVRAWPWLIALYVLVMAVLLVSTIPTFSGKLLGERISGDYVLPMFVGAAAVVALLLTYPYGTLTVGTLLYLATIPLSYFRFERKLYAPAPPSGETKH
jgi:CDP-diacylglycerol--serine O-phosphatidyltransferase